MIASGVKAALTWRPVWQLTRPIGAQGCFVLLYHRIGSAGDPFPHLDMGMFQAHMEFLIRRCTPISPDDLEDAMSRRFGWTRPPVLVTFDDGYCDYLHTAYPILKRMGIPAVNFIATHYVDTGRQFWWDVLHAAVTASSGPRSSLPWWASVQPFEGPHSRAAFLRTAKEHLRATSNARRGAVLSEIVETLGVDEGSLGIPRQVMTWDELRAISDITTIGAHTHTHPLMGQVASEIVDEEVVTSRDRIAAEMGKMPRLFAYPGGLISDAAREAVRRAGFSAAFVTSLGVNGPRIDRFAAHRMPGPTTLGELAWRLSGMPFTSKGERRIAYAEGSPSSLTRRTDAPWKLYIPGFSWRRTPERGSTRVSPGQAASESIFGLVQRDVARYCQRGGRPAAQSVFRVCHTCLTTPGLHAILVFRYGNWVIRRFRSKLLRAPFKLLYQLLNFLIMVMWDVQIDPEANIGGGLFLGHHSGILIGPVTMGQDCNVAHQVTIGRRADGSPEVPVIGDRVWIGVGAVVFGRIRIGDGVTIGPLTVVGRSLPPKVLVMGNPMRVLRTNYDNSIEIYGRPGRLRDAGDPEPDGSVTQAVAPEVTDAAVEV